MGAQGEREGDSREKGKSATLKDLDYRDERRVVSNPNADVKRAIAKDVAFMEKNADSSTAP